MRLAIVGSAELSKPQVEEATWLIDLVVGQFGRTYSSDLTIVSGGAGGVDTLAETAATDYGIHFKVFEPERRGWEDRDGKIGFKTRNMRVGDYCDYMVCIRSRTSKTYGSGWTADYTEKLGKTVRRLYV